MGGDFFKDEFPAVDVFIYGHILHGWGEETKQLLIQKAYDALNPAFSNQFIHSFSV